jgi:hypothetical protein
VGATDGESEWSVPIQRWRRHGQMTDGRPCGITGRRNGASKEKCPIDHILRAMIGVVKKAHILFSARKTRYAF